MLSQSLLKFAELTTGLFTQLVPRPRKSLQNIYTTTDNSNTSKLVLAWFSMFWDHGMCGLQQSGLPLSADGQPRATAIAWIVLGVS